MSLLQVSFHVTNVWHILALRCASFYVGLTNLYVWHDAFIRVTYASFICVTYVTCHTYEWGFVYLGAEACLIDMWGIHMCVMTHSYVWCVTCASFICVTWCIHMWGIHMCVMTHSYMWRVTWRIPMCDMMHSYVWHDAFIFVTYLSAETYLIHMCETCLIHMCETCLILYGTYVTCHTYECMCDMTHSYVWYNAFIRVTCAWFISVTWRSHTCDMMHSYVWHVPHS